MWRDWQQIVADQDGFDMYYQFKKTLGMTRDDYKKDGEAGVRWPLCGFYRDLLRTLVITDVGNFTVWRGSVQENHRGQSKLSHEYQLIIARPHKKVSIAKELHKSQANFCVIVCSASVMLTEMIVSEIHGDFLCSRNTPMTRTLLNFRMKSCFKELLWYIYPRIDADSSKIRMFLSVIYKTHEIKENKIISCL